MQASEFGCLTQGESMRNDEEHLMELRGEERSAVTEVEATDSPYNAESTPGKSAPVSFEPGAYVQWESMGVLKMPVAKKLSHFSDDGNFAFLEGSTTGVPIEELIAADRPSPFVDETEIALDAAATDAERILETEGAGIRATKTLGSELETAPNALSDSTHTLTTASDERVSGDKDSSSEAAASSDGNSADTADSDELPLDNSILSVIDQAQRIDRFPGNSVVDYVRDKEFSQTWLDQLYARWNDGVEAFFVGLGGRCELVYEIHKETVKPGCNGGFSAALRRIKLAASTAYDMIARHKIRIGEMEDPDAYDTRDDEDEGEKGDAEEEQDENEEQSTGSSSNRGAKGGKARPKAAIITLSGTIAEAVTAIQNYYHKTNAKEVITFCVLRVWSDLKMPLANRSDDSAESMSPAVSKPKRTSLLLDDDFLAEASAIGDPKPVISEYPAYEQVSKEVGNDSASA
jgi:hypothetical protein